MNKNLRAKLRANKKKHNLLLKEYDSTSEHRRREIRIELGIATLRDLLGDAMPIKVCKHCGKQAMTESDCWEFHGMICKTCKSLLVLQKDIQIVGPYSLLKDKPKVCLHCQRADVEFADKRYKICKVCLGQTIVLPDGKSTYDVERIRVPIVINNITYSSIRQASVLLNIPYATIRYQVITGNIKLGEKNE